MQYNMVIVKFKYKNWWKYFSPKWRMIREDTERFMNESFERQWDKIRAKKKDKKLPEFRTIVRI